MIHILEKKPDDFKYWKYLDTNGIIKTIENMEIQCSAVKNLNDPFDCAPPFTCKEEYEKDDTIRRNKYENSENGFISIILQNYYVSSFTLSGYGNILMWGHYTNKYNGGVIEFKNTHSLFKNSISKVHYQKNPVEVSKDFFEFFKMERTFIPKIKPVLKDIHKMYTTKYKDWAYEKEIRYFTGAPSSEDEKNLTVANKNKLEQLECRVCNGQRYVYVKLTADNINAIYIGEKMSGFDRLHLYMALKKHSINVPVYIMKRGIKNFEIKKLNDDSFQLCFILKKIFNDIEHCPEKFETLHSTLKELNQDDLFNSLITALENNSSVENLRKIVYKEYQE